MLGWFSSSSATVYDKELVMMKKSDFVESDNITSVGQRCAAQRRDAG